MVVVPELLNETKQTLDFEPGSAPTPVGDFPRYAQYQILSNWCWDAVGSAISSFYLKSAVGSSGIQSHNASTYLKGASGCKDINVPNHGPVANWAPSMQQPTGPIHFNPGKVPCNQGGWPQNVTNGTGSLSSSQVNYPGGRGPDSSQIADVVNALAAGNPVVPVIDWYGPGAHVVTIYGTHVSGGTRYYYVADPWDGFHIWSQVPGGTNRGQGYWYGSVFTEKS